MRWTSCKHYLWSCELNLTGQYSYVDEAQDNLLLAKTAQVTASDRTRAPEHQYAAGDLVMLSTFHRRREFMQKGDKRVAKFMA